MKLIAPEIRCKADEVEATTYQMERDGRTFEVIAYTQAGAQLALDEYFAAGKAAHAIEGQGEFPVFGLPPGQEEPIL